MNKINKINKILIIVGSIVGGLLFILFIIWLLKKYIIKPEQNEQTQNNLTQDEKLSISNFFNYLNSNNISIKRESKTQNNIFKIKINSTNYLIYIRNSYLIFNNIILYYEINGDEYKELINIKFIGNQFEYNNYTYEYTIINNILTI